MHAALSFLLIAICPLAMVLMGAGAWISAKLGRRHD
jgi:hypothetical protein